MNSNPIQCVIPNSAVIHHGWLLSGIRRLLQSGNLISIQCECSPTNRNKNPHPAQTQKVSDRAERVNIESLSRVYPNETKHEMYHYTLRWFCDQLARPQAFHLIWRKITFFSLSSITQQGYFFPESAIKCSTLHDFQYMFYIIIF